MRAAVALVSSLRMNPFFLMRVHHDNETTRVLEFEDDVLTKHTVDLMFLKLVKELRYNLKELTFTAVNVDTNCRMLLQQCFDQCELKLCWEQIPLPNREVLRMHLHTQELRGIFREEEEEDEEQEEEDEGEEEETTSGNSAD